MGLGNKEVFAKNLRNLIRRSGKDRKQVANDLGLPYSTVTDWINGNKYPRINNIEKLARYFGASKTELIEDLDLIKKDNDRLVSIIVKLRTNKELVDAVEKLSSLDKEKLKRLSSFLDTFIQ